MSGMLWSGKRSAVPGTLSDTRARREQGLGAANAPPQFLSRSGPAHPRGQATVRFPKSNLVTFPFSG